MKKHTLEDADDMDALANIYQRHNPTYAERLRKMAHGLREALSREAESPRRFAAAEGPRPYGAAESGAQSPPQAAQSIFEQERAAQQRRSTTDGVLLVILERETLAAEVRTAITTLHRVLRCLRTPPR